jgi:transposase
VSVRCAPVTVSTIVVAVDVGKTSAVMSVTDSARQQLLGPVEFAMTRSGSAAVMHQVAAELPSSAQVKVGIEAAGHYHRPCWIICGRLVGKCWSSILLMSLSSAGCKARAGSRPMRSIWWRLVTDGEVLLGELAAWAGHRSRRVATRTATKNQLLGQVDRSFPG